MPTYAEQEREWRDEHLDWLHQQHEELAEQTALLREQTFTLQRMARHTGLLYAVAIVWLVVLALAFIGGVISAIAST